MNNSAHNDSLLQRNDDEKMPLATEKDAVKEQKVSESNIEMMNSNGNKPSETIQEP